MKEWYDVMQTVFRPLISSRSPICVERFDESATTDTTGTFGMHICLINQGPWPHKPPTLWHTRTYWHTPRRWIKKETAAGRICSLLGREGGSRETGRLWVCHINNSQVGWSRAINVPSRFRPSELRNPGVMGSSWTKVSGRTAEKAEVSVGNTRHYQPPETKAWCLPTRNSLQLVYLKRKTRQELDYFE